MATVTNTAETGLSSGTAVTTANSAAPDAWTLVSAGTGGSITFSSVHVFDGSLATAYLPANGVSCYTQWDNISGGNNLCAFRGYLYVTALPATEANIISFRSSSAATAVVGVSLVSDGTFHILNNIAANDIATTTGAISINTWYRIEAQINNTGGTFSFQVYAGNSGSVLTGLNVAATGLSLGTNTLGAIRVGRTSTTGNISSAMYWDDVSFKTASNSAIGVYVPPSPPTAAFTYTPQALTVAVDGTTSTAAAGRRSPATPGTSGTATPAPDQPRATPMGLPARTRSVLRSPTPTG
jgi:hypothetical protein